MNKNSRTITVMDRCRLGSLLAAPATASLASRQSRFSLEFKIEEATAILPQLTPATLVTMNSTIVLRQMDSGARTQCTLVYPDDRDLMPHSVEIFDEIGQELIGRSVGDVFEFRDVTGLHRILIESLVYQPEAAGQLAF
jgi:regulator of nucleoside diphosphate kinase